MNFSPGTSGLRTLLLAAIRLYQGFVSPLAPSACKFYPSCSRYAYEAIERYGPHRGIRLALERLWRCRPFASGGLDPVPELPLDAARATLSGSRSVEAAGLRQATREVVR